MLLRFLTYINDKYGGNQTMIKTLKTSLSLFFMLFFLTGCSLDEVLDLGLDSLKEVTSDLTVKEPVKDNQTIEELKTKEFISGDKAFIPVNHNQSSLNFDRWDAEKVIYSDLDSLNRVGSMTAYLSNKNLGSSDNRSSQVWKPTGWHNQQKTIDGKQVSAQNRGHLLAYTLSFNFDDEGDYARGYEGSEDNPKNLFTQTEYANQKVMTLFEEDVRQALKQDKRVIYQVTPVFRDNELMARGVHLEALSKDGALNFNVYIWNVQPNFSYDYSTGSFTTDKKMVVKLN